MQYLAILAVFVVVYALIHKFNSATVARVVKNAEKDPSFGQLATALHCAAEDIELGASGKRTIYNSGKRAHGVYRNHPIEIVAASRSDQYAEGLDTGYSYRTEKFIKVAVNTSPTATFTISPKNKAVQHVGTGSAAFDENLSMTGNVRLSLPTLESLAEYGWMNLTLKDQQLIFDDTFLEESSAAMNPVRARSAMKNTHPVWGSSMTSPTLDVARSTAFVDLMIDIAKEV